MAAPERTEAGGADGVIKFTVAKRVVVPGLPGDEWERVEEIRSLLWRAGLVGHDPELDVGYGNISARRPDGGFVISGTQTGHKDRLGPGDYVIVDAWDFSSGSVDCRGACLPSSEALSHAALYRRPDVGGVIHVHARRLWEAMARAGDLCTGENIPYGSRMLYNRLGELALERGNLPILVVALGHQDGVFAAGTDLRQAYDAIMERARRI